MSGEGCRGLRIGLILGALALIGLPACGSTPERADPAPISDGQPRRGHENAGRDRALAQLDRNLAGDVPIEDARPLDAPHVPPAHSRSAATPVNTATAGEATSSDNWPVDKVEDLGDTLVFWSTGEGATLAEALANGDSRARQEAMNTRSSKITTVSSDNVSSLTGGSFESSTQIASEGALHGVAKATSAAWTRLEDGSFWVHARLEVPADQIYPQRELDRILATGSGQQQLADLWAFHTRAETRGDATFAARSALRLLELDPGLPTLNAAVEAQLQASNYFRAQSLVDLHADGLQPDAVAALRTRIEQAIPDARGTLDRLLRQARTAANLQLDGPRPRISAGDEIRITGDIPEDHGYALVWLDESNLQVPILFGAQGAGGKRSYRSAGGTGSLPMGPLVYGVEYREGDALVPGDVQLIVLAAPAGVDLDPIEIDLAKCVRKDPTELRRFHELMARLEDFISTPAADHRIGVATWTQYE